MLHVMATATSPYMPRTSVGPLLLPALLLLGAAACAPDRPSERPCNTDFECGNHAVCSYGVCAKAPRPAYGPDGEGVDPFDPIDQPVIEKPEDEDPIPSRFDVTFDNGVHTDDDLSAAPFAVHLDADHPLLAQLTGGRSVELMAMHAGEPLELPLDVERFDDGGALFWSRLPTARTSVVEVWFETSDDGVPEDTRADVWAGYDAVYHLAGHAADATGGWQAFEAHGTEVVTDCALGGCRTFDGDDWIDLSSEGGEPLPWLNGVQGITIEAWVKRVGDSGDFVSIGTGATGSVPTASRASLMYREGQPAGFARAPDALGQKRSTALEADTLEDWHHIAMVVRLPGEAGGMGNVRLYEDGEEVAYAEGPEHLFEEAVTSTEGSQLAALGADDDGQSLWFTGTLDEVRIKPSATSSAQLRAGAWAASDGYASVGEGIVVD